MDTEQLTPIQIVEEYKTDVEKLLKYQPYFEKMAGKASSSTFNQEGLAEHSLAFPVYDSTLLQFVREAETTKFMNPNYHYVYTRNRLKTVEDELEAVAGCTIQKIDVLGGILSKYVYVGKVKGAIWSAGVKNGVFLAILLKMKEIIHFWESNA